MSGANLTCYKFACSGEFQYHGGDDGETLYECRECGAELREQGVRELADMDGPMSELAELLLNGGEA